MNGASEHLDVIASEIKRLDEVITGFVRFIRPEELQASPDGRERAHQRGDQRWSSPTHGARASPAGADVSKRAALARRSALLRQALLNLALNGCQAMPNGGKLTMGARTIKDRHVELSLEDTRRRDIGR